MRRLVIWTVVGLLVSCSLAAGDGGGTGDATVAATGDAGPTSSAPPLTTAESPATGSPTTTVSNEVAQHFSSEQLSAALPAMAALPFTFATPSVADNQDLTSTFQVQGCNGGPTTIAGNDAATVNRIYRDEAGGYTVKVTVYDLDEVAGADQALDAVQTIAGCPTLTHVSLREVTVGAATPACTRALAYLVAQPEAVTATGLCRVANLMALIDVQPGEDANTADPISDQRLLATIQVVGAGLVALFSPT